MIAMAHFFSRIFQTAYLIVFCVTLVSYGEEPSFHAGFLQWGESPKVCDYQWAHLYISPVSNPTDKEVELILSIRAEDNPAALYSKKIRLGPGAAMRHMLNLVAEPRKEYVVTLSYADGRLIQKQSVLSNHQNPFMTVPVFFGSDDEDLEGYSHLAKHKSLGRRIIFARSRAENFPRHLPGFGSASVLVLIDLDFACMSSLQFDAVEAFVSCGGTLLVIGPETVMEMEKTPLSELLPVIPLGVRPIGTFPELGQWGTSGDSLPGPAWDAGIDFLEMMPGKNTVTTLRHGRLPAIVWGRYGLGKVAVLGFDAFAAGIRDEEYSSTIWRHILSNVSDQPFGSMAMYDKTLSQVTSRLIGFNTRPVKAVLAVMVAYLTLIFALFLLGTLLKKQVLSWVGGVACSLILTFLILTAADRQFDQQAPQNAIAVDLACQTAMIDGATGVFSGEKRITVINREPDRPDVRGQAPGVWLRPEAPEPAMINKQIKRSTIFSFMKKEGRHGLNRLNVPENKPVTFFTRYENQKGAGIEPLSLVYENGSPRLAGSGLPEDFPGLNTKAYLVLDGGIQRVQIQKNRFILTADDGGGMELDLSAKDIENFLRTARLPVPALALFYKASTPSSDLSIGDGEYKEQRYRLHLVPVHIPAGKGPVLLPGVAVKIVPADKPARTLRQNGLWRDGFIYTGTNRYLFAAHVPLAFRDMKITRAEVTLSIRDSSNSVKGTVKLLPFENAPVSTRQSAGISPTEVNGERLIFTGLDAARLIHPVDGSIRVRLSMSKNGDPAPAGQLASNTKWRVQAFSISLEGTRD